MKLNELIENPNNPSKCSDEQFERLIGKLKRVPKGLTAIRIAYVTDIEDGKKVVLSGNKRLRALKKFFGENVDLPDEYFQDITSMSEAERHEFIVTANVNDGEWDLNKLFDQYDPELFNDFGINDLLTQKPTNIDGQEFFEDSDEEHTKKIKTMICPYCGEEFEL